MRVQWREGNQVTLLPGSENYLPALFKAMDEAQTSLIIALYAVEDGELGERFITTLEQARSRGVKVWLLVDACGSWPLSKKSRQRIKDTGVEFREFNPLSWRHLGRFISRDHRKLVIVDGRMAFVGGFGMTDLFMKSWFEIAVRVEGACVNDWIALNRQVWNSRMTRGPGQDMVSRDELGATAEEVRKPAGEMEGRVIWGKGYRFQKIRRSLQTQIDRAENQVWICTPYFVPTPSLRRRMMRAARRGVDVRVLVPAKNHDHPGVYYAGQRLYTRLMRAAIRMFEYQPRFSHAKFSMCDDWCTVGSCNFDHWSLQWNLEANQEVDHPGFASDLADLFRSNFEQSKEIDFEQWKARPTGQKVREYVYGKLNAMLTRLK